jgi:hypothetical protein
VTLRSSLLKGIHHVILCLQRRQSDEGNISDPCWYVLISPMASEPQHFRVTYNEVHNLIKRSAEEISEFKPDIIVAIGTVSNSQLKSVAFLTR